MQLAVADIANLPAAIRDDQIVALCDQAIDRLGEARTLEDVLGIKNVAEAWEVYTRKLDASTEAQIACTRVTLLAKAKIGSELQAAQERGEIATQQVGRPISVRASDTYSATLSEIGIPRQRAAEYKALAEAGEAAIREEVIEAKAEGRHPSQKRIIDRAKASKKPRIRKPLIAAIPVIGNRPPVLNDFILWLRSGATVLSKLENAPSLVALCREHAVGIPPAEVAAVAAFMIDLQGEIE